MIAKPELDGTVPELWLKSTASEVAKEKANQGIPTVSRPHYVMAELTYVS